MLVILESPILRVLRDPMWQTDPHVCSQTKQKPCNEPICNPNKNWLLSMGITHWNLVGFHPLIKCHLANPSICLEKTRENPPISNFKDILLRFPPISSCMGVGIFIPFHVMCMYIYIIYHIPCWYPPDHVEIMIMYVVLIHTRKELWANQNILTMSKSYQPLLLVESLFLHT